MHANKNCTYVLHTYQWLQNLVTATQGPAQGQATHHSLETIEKSLHKHYNLLIVCVSRIVMTAKVESDTGSFGILQELDARYTEGKKCSIQQRNMFKLPSL